MWPKPYSHSPAPIQSTVVTSRLRNSSSYRHTITPTPSAPHSRVLTSGNSAASAPALDKPREFDPPGQEARPPGMTDVVTTVHVDCSWRHMGCLLARMRQASKAGLSGPKNRVSDRRSFGPDRGASCPYPVVGGPQCEDRTGLRYAHQGMGCRWSGWRYRGKEVEGEDFDCSLGVDRRVDKDLDSDKMGGAMCLIGPGF